MDLTQRMLKAASWALTYGVQPGDAYRGSFESSLFIRPGHAEVSPAWPAKSSHFVIADESFEHVKDQHRQVYPLVIVQDAFYPELDYIGLMRLTIWHAREFVLTCHLKDHEVQRVRSMAHVLLWREVYTEEFEVQVNSDHVSCTREYVLRLYYVKGGL